MHPLIAQLDTALRPAADTQHAEKMSAYMQHQLHFLGIPTPARRALSIPFLRPYYRADFAEIQDIVLQLWGQHEREFHYCAIDLLGKARRYLPASALPFLLDLARQHAWWDSVDGLADVAGDLIRLQRQDQPQVLSQIEQAVQHPSFWIRRIAMLHQCGWRAETDSERLFRFALTLAPEQEFFIRKAIGWALRDYARHAPQEVAQFLHLHGTQLSALSRREAAKHLPVVI
ncbi:DNA alkylation repair protein [Undibacterium rugosum]|uniref:DNA alkylation repair protein n=1 Tax=Undibacterium rugosum TaxID=2762291 RepID=A0A923KZ93_9BURK|nr:DNA alkylation repair protein [Undibacterium rugosum]MBC3934686.1 DNA alkylation repair protein [Undibacterium rugosum]MBR7779764.1 DNA alkylation repair protein [Undibacterium rugosum]